MLKMGGGSGGIGDGRLSPEDLGRSSCRRVSPRDLGVIKERIRGNRVDVDIEERASSIASQLKESTPLKRESCGGVLVIRSPPNLPSLVLTLLHFHLPSS